MRPPTSDGQKKAPARSGALVRLTGRARLFIAYIRTVDRGLETGPRHQQNCTDCHKENARPVRSEPQESHTSGRPLIIDPAPASSVPNACRFATDQTRARRVGLELSSRRCLNFIPGLLTWVRRGGACLPGYDAVGCALS